MTDTAIRQYEAMLDDLRRRDQERGLNPSEQVACTYVEKLLSGEDGAGPAPPEFWKEYVRFDLGSPRGKTESELLDTPERLTPEDKPKWSLFPLERFKEISLQDLWLMVEILERDFHVKTPKGLEHYDHPGVKAFVMEACQSDAVRELWEEQQHEKLLMAFYRVTKSGIQLEYSTIAEHLRTQFCAIAWKKALYIYRDGTYKENEGEVEAAINAICEEVDFKGKATTVTREILHYMTFKDISREYPFNRCKDLIPVANGVVKVDFASGKKELLPYSPEYRFTFKFPVIFDPLASGHAFHERVISQYVEEELVPVLYQIPAQAILQFQGTKPFKKSYILQGDANAGKTTYMEWLEALFGKENLARTSLHEIGNDRHVNAGLEGKILNACDDLSDVPLENIGPFKALTGGFAHEIRRLYRDKYEGIVFAVHVFTCNAPPDVPDKILFDSAFWERWEYIHFPNVFEVDERFKERWFTGEHLSGSFNKVLDTMIAIRRRGGLQLSRSPSEVKDAWQLASDPFAQFVADEMMDAKGETSFSKDPLLLVFRRWCHENEVSERKIPTTVTALSTMAFKSGFKEAKRGKKKEQRHVYVALKTWKPDSKYAITKEDEEAGPNRRI